jgi:hypothetical protein
VQVEEGNRAVGRGRMVPWLLSGLEWTLLSACFVSVNARLHDLCWPSSDQSLDRPPNQCLDRVCQERVKSKGDIRLKRRKDTKCTHARAPSLLKRLPRSWYKVDGTRGTSSLISGGVWHVVQTQSGPGLHCGGGFLRRWVEVVRWKTWKGAVNRHIHRVESLRCGGGRTAALGV